MLQKGSAKKVTIYVNEDTQYHLQPLFLCVSVATIPNQFSDEIYDSAT